jgi:5'-deoxynucleotidase YfbR-like HD superfamily hydrolase
MSDTRTHDWIRTYTGKRFYLFDPTTEMVCIEDIAHALSMLCRYTGHVQRFYSVAEHSMLVTGEVATQLHKDATPGLHHLNLLRWALLHDASEAYLGDVSRPLKWQPEMSRYRETEERVMRVIALRFGLEGPEPELVARLDKEIIGTECRALKFGEGLATVDPLPEMLPGLREGAHTMGVPPEVAERNFLRMWTAIDSAGGSRPFAMPMASA